MSYPKQFSKNQPYYNFVDSFTEFVPLLPSDTPLVVTVHNPHINSAKYAWYNYLRHRFQAIKTHTIKVIPAEPNKSSLIISCKLPPQRATLGRFTGQQQQAEQPYQTPYQSKEEALEALKELPPIDAPEASPPKKSPFDILNKKGYKKGLEDILDEEDKNGP